MTNLAKILSAVVLLSLAACGQYTLVKPGPAKFGDLSVSPSMAWSQLSVGNGYVWTIAGQFLHEIAFITDLGNDEALVTARSGKPLPTFKTGMTPIEISDMFKNTLAALGVRDLKIENLRPAKLGGADGFRFEFDYRTADGVEKTGIAVGAIRNKKLNLVYYHGTKLHYFGRYRDEFEAILASARFS